MAISTSLLNRVPAGPVLTSKFSAPKATFDDRFVASTPDSLIFKRPTFAGATESAAPPALQLGGWQSVLTGLNPGQPANDSSWVQQHKEFQRECYYCDGTGKCQHDDVAGSGKINGEDDYEFCGGTGKCEHCGGDGDMGN